MSDFSPIRITVTPSQTAYFAGETFKAVIKFANTSTAPSAISPIQTGTPILSQKPSPYKHKRSSHSVSSVALARPPTSAGTPRVSAPAGQSPNLADGTVTPSKKGLLRGRSFSVDVKSDIDYVKVQASQRQGDTPPSFVPPDHPHARRTSVLDGQLQLTEVSRSYPPSPTMTVTTPSTSTFSLSLDPISEVPPHFARSAARKPPRLGLEGSSYPSHVSTSTSQVIMYSYAQLMGSMRITPPLTPAPSAEQKMNADSLRSKLVSRTLALGGGSMDIHAFLNRKAKHRRSATFSAAGLMSLISPQPVTASSLSTSQSSPTSPNGLAPPTPSTFEDDTVDPDTPLPTFEVQPAMLAVELTLSPGESKTYTYAVELPDVLPPTHKGPSLIFNYELVIGICRGGMSESVSRVMRVPVRLYNHVSVGRAPNSYNLLWPLARRRNPNLVPAPLVEEVGATMHLSRSTTSGKPVAGLIKLQDYGQLLLRSLNTATDEIAVLSASVEDSLIREEDGVLTGCREAVEILTRNHKKVSYEVQKNEVNMAILTFPKVAYRLGETIFGIVELNQRLSPARVLSLSAKLETQEMLPQSLSSSQNSKLLRRVHAEYNAALVASSKRITFSLDIPSDASPMFQVDLDNEVAPTPAGLSWRVRLSLLVAVDSEASNITTTDHQQLKHLRLDGTVGEWGSTWIAPSNIAPLQKKRSNTEISSALSWTRFIVSTLIGDGKDGNEAEVNGTGVSHQPDDDREEGDEGWQEMGVETVECEIPISIWPGNTAFKPSDVVFTV